MKPSRMIKNGRMKIRNSKNYQELPGDHIT